MLLFFMIIKPIFGVFLVISSFVLFYVEIFNINLLILWFLNFIGSLILVSKWTDLIKNKLIRIIITILAGFICMALISVLQIYIYINYINPIDWTDKLIYHFTKPVDLTTGKTIY